MRLSSYFFTAITLIFAFILILFGAYFFIFPQTGEFRQELYRLLNESDHFYWILGTLLSLTGLILLIASFFVTKRDHFFVTYQSRGPIELDPSIIKSYVEEYLKEFFANEALSVDLALKAGKIHIVADLPKVAFKDQKEIVERIQKDLRNLFETTFDYKEDFYISLSFEKKKL